MLNMKNDLDIHHSIFERLAGINRCKNQDFKFDSLGNKDLANEKMIISFLETGIEILNHTLIMTNVKML